MISIIAIYLKLIDDRKNKLIDDRKNTILYHIQYIYIYMISYIGWLNWWNMNKTQCYMI